MTALLFSMVFLVQVPSILVVELSFIVFQCSLGGVYKTCQFVSRGENVSSIFSRFGIHQEYLNFVLVGSISFITSSACASMQESIVFSLLFLYSPFLSILYSGITDRNMPGDNPTPAETSTSGKANSSSSQLTKTEKLRNRKKYSEILRTFMDEKAPIGKKVSIILILLLLMMVDSQSTD